MKLRSFNRRNFFQLLLSAFVVSSCKKSSPFEPKTIIPPTPPSNDYLGTYVLTEYGPGLADSPDLSQSIYGYSDKVSYTQGDNVSLFLSGPTNKSQTISLYDANQNVMDTVTIPISVQTINNPKPWVDGCGFNKTLDRKLPANLKSGLYQWTGLSPFIVKSATAAHDITVVYPSNTNNAYNQAGGKSLYNPVNRASVVSFLRFQYGPGDYTSSFYSWMNLQSYDVNYIADIDLEDYSQIQNSKLVIITGHSEYWTRQARENIDQFVASGKNLLVLSGNTMWWQVRYNQPKDLMICYKLNSADPLKNTIYSTVNWPEQLLSYPTAPSIGIDYNHGGYGNKLPNRWNGYKIIAERSPLFSGTGLKNGDILSVPTVEYDCVPVVNMIAPGSSEIPIVNNKVLGFHQVELLGYDFAFNENKSDGLGLGTFIVFQKNPSSGTVVNVASTNWCSPTGIGGLDQIKIETITKNMIDLSLNNGNLFTT